MTGKGCLEQSAMLELLFWQQTQGHAEQLFILLAETPTKEAFQSSHPPGACMVEDDSHKVHEYEACQAGTRVRDAEQSAGVLGGNILHGMSRSV